MILKENDPSINNAKKECKSLASRNKDNKKANKKIEQRNTYVSRT